MRTRWRRVRALVDRYRVDRRLPPPVLELYKRAGAARIGRISDRVVARLRPALGAASGTRDVAQLGRRNIAVDGPLPMSCDALAHSNAATVVDALGARSIRPFLTGRQGDGLSFGVRLDEREVALQAIVTLADRGAWYLTWDDGMRTGTVDIAAAPGDHHVRRARRWRIFRAHRWGEVAIGSEQAVIVEFWEIGTSGEFELIGSRGHHRFDDRAAPTDEMIDARSYPGNTAFPVSTDLSRMIDPIDIVYTWVDGADPDWQADFRAAAAEAGRTLDDPALDPARYTTRDELRYSMRSVWAFAGWARRIFIVTSGQVPTWLVEDERVTVVPHSEILPADVLPTFNSHAIESSLHRIDGLSEHFIYFNDDVFLGTTVRPETFFTGNGLPLNFASGARVPGHEDDDTQAVDTAALRGRQLLAERFGRVAADKPMHSPFPLRCSVLRDIDAEFPDIVAATRASRFRSPLDLSIASSFAQHYAVATGRSVIGSIDALYVHLESGRLSHSLDRLLDGRDVQTFCLNETSTQHGNAAEREAAVARFFERYFPVPAPWESDRKADA